MELQGNTGKSLWQQICKKHLFGKVFQTGQTLSDVKRRVKIKCEVYAMSFPLSVLLAFAVGKVVYDDVDMALGQWFGLAVSMITGYTVFLLVLM